MEGLTTNKGGRILSDNMNTEQHHSHEGIYPQGMSKSNRRNYPDDSSDDNRSYRGQRYPNEGGRLPDEGRYPNRER